MQRRVPASVPPPLSDGRRVSGTAASSRGGRAAFFLPRSDAAEGAGAPRMAFGTLVRTSSHASLILLNSGGPAAVSRARARWSSCALFWRISVVCGRPTSSRAARSGVPSTLTFFSTLNSYPWSLLPRTRRGSIRALSTASRGQALRWERRHASSLAAEGVLAEVWIFPERKPGAC